MNKDERTAYLANIYHALLADGEVARIEEDVFEEISRDIRAGYMERKEAKKLSASGGFTIQSVGRWSDRVRNLEDILFAAFCNDAVDRAEKKLIQVCANQMGINQQQFNVIKEETRRRYAEFKKNPIR